MNEIHMSGGAAAVADDDRSLNRRVRNQSYTDTSGGHAAETAQKIWRKLAGRETNLGVAQYSTKNYGGLEASDKTDKKPNDYV